MSVNVAQARRVPDPKKRLEHNITELCRRCARGKAAAKNHVVRFHVILKLVAIFLSSVGSFGVIVDKLGQPASPLPGAATSSEASLAAPSSFGPAIKPSQESSLTFWASATMLLFGIVSQIASEFNLAKRAADSLAIATTCAVYETRMESVLNQDDPGAGVVNMLVELSERFESEQFNRVLPSDDEDDPKCRDRNLKADARAKKLISSYGQFWNLRVLDNRGVSAPRKPSASQPTEEGSDPLAE